MSAAALSAEPSLSHRLGLILAGLRERLAVRAARDRALAALLVLLWNRLSRTLARVAAIAARHQAGTLRTPSKPHRRAASASPPLRDPLPRRSGWLLRLGLDCAAYGEYLRLLLAEPETAVMIEAAPQLRRLLRPLWRMLQPGPVPEVLRGPKPPPGPPRPTPRRPRQAAPPPQRAAGLSASGSSPRVPASWPGSTRPSASRGPGGTAPVATRSACHRQPMAGSSSVAIANPAITAPKRPSAYAVPPQAPVRPHPSPPRLIRKQA